MKAKRAQERAGADGPNAIAGAGSISASAARTTAYQDLVAVAVAALERAVAVAEGDDDHRRATLARAHAEVLRTAVAAARDLAERAAVMDQRDDLAGVDVVAEQPAAEVVDAGGEVVPTLRCYDCNLNKPATAFAPDRRTRRRRALVCDDCRGDGR